MNEAGSRYSRCDQPRATPENLAAVSALLTIPLRQTSFGQLAHGLHLLPAAQMAKKSVPDFPMKQVVIVIHDQLVVVIPIHERRASVAPSRIQKLRERQILGVWQQHERTAAELAHARAV